MREKTVFRIPLIGILLSVMAVFILLSFNKIVSSAAEGDYLTFTAQEDSTITFNWKSGSNVQTSTDGGKTWSNYAAGTTISLAQNSSISFKANDIVTDEEHHFQINGKVSASGDVTSLTNGKGGNCQLSKYCYAHMFYCCTGLTTAPSLPATTLTNGCYQCMFSGCTGLTTVPSLPATTMTFACYNAMFSRCISLTSIPELQATTLADYCYYNMFYGCTGLIVKSYGPGKEWSIPATASSSASNATDWNSDMFTGNSSKSDVTKPEPGVTYYIVQPSYLTFTAKKNSTIIFNWERGTDVQTSTDGGETWLDYDAGTTINLAKNSSVSFKANNIRTNDDNHFQIMGNVSASGDVTSLTNSMGGDCKLDENCYYCMFKDCTSLTTAPSLPATTLASGCYLNMFEGCTGLTVAPSLPATDVPYYCYYSMFSGCTNLTIAPALPATILEHNCYNSMFYNCTSLTTAPALPATTLAEYCYDSMFCGCTSLITAPALPATTLANFCYCSMFESCSNLTTAPALPATTLAYGCYGGMFKDCTSLTTAPALPATTLAEYCYNSMFCGCTSLITAPALPATTLADWCCCSMFESCSNLTTAPALPATTLADGCYGGMFKDCTSLTSAPALPATTLSHYCYNNMFDGCTSLIIKSSGLGKEWSISAEVISSAYNVSWNYNMFANTSSESDVTEPEPGVTYYIVSDTSYLAEIESFVTRLYEICLDREPDTDGLNNWVNDLASGEKTGVDVASGFIFSTEFSNHNYCNSCYVEHLYNAFLGRSSDPDGKAYWINKLETGMTREEVFNGFALSPEFKNICDEYGIVQGVGLTIPEYGTVPKGSCSADGTVDGVTSFVTRLYNVCLDRDPDATGLSNWTNALWSHERSGSEVASGFIFSQEFTNKNYDDETYVEYLYRAFFDRASDPTGKADWVSKLQNGASREEIFNGFTGSQEFMTLCAKYGIVR